ncbi:MAG TPA: MBG domain-containing protein [Acidimicrobiales bacterium]|nr:MBG domain-containing protein [Acidimicrobiales bacterium]
MGLSVGTVVALLLSLGAWGGATINAYALTATVTNWTDLQTAFASSGTVTLGADITAPSSSNLAMTAGTTVTLDLDGHSLSITSPPTGAAGVQDTAATLTIEDPTGTGVLTATGSSDGNGGAGIGGSPGSKAGSVADGGTLTVSGGTVNATGGTSGAGIGGGGFDADSGSVTITGGTVNATGGAFGAGIGGGKTGPGATVTISGGIVNAGSGGGAGIGSGAQNCGASLSAGTVTITGGTVFANTAFGAGIGGGDCGDGGDVSIGSGAVVTATGTATAIGSGGDGNSVFGSVSNSGKLTLNGQEVVPTAVTASNGGFMNNAGGTISVTGPLGGGGTVVNNGSILIDSGGSVANDGTTVTEHDYAVSYSMNGVSGTAPPSQSVYAASFSDDQMTLPAPPTGYVWSDSQSGGTTVTDGTDLPSLFGQSPGGATAVTLYLKAPPETVTFNPENGQESTAETVAYGSDATRPADPARAGYVFDGWFTAATGGSAYDFTVTVTSSFTLYAQWALSTVPVTVTVNGSQTFGGTPIFSTSQSLPAGITLSGSAVCSTVDGGTAISAGLPVAGYTIDAASCSGLSLSGSGSSNYVIAYTGGMFTVSPAPVAVTVNGSQTFGGSPIFSTSQSLPPGITLTGSAACSTVNGGTAISTGLPVAGYTIDAASCSGLSLSGSGSSNYVLSLTGGMFTVNPAPVAVTVNGSQTFGGTPDFSTSQSLPPGITLTGSAVCTTVNGGTPISTSLPVAGYTIDAASCSGLSLSGSGSSNYVIAYTGGTFTVSPAPVAVTVNGSQTFGGTPIFSTSQSLPPGITLTGSAVCTTVNGGTAISTSLPVAAYTVDAASCSGLSLSGSGSSNYVIAYTGGTFTVSPAPVAVTVNGSQTFGGTPIFSTSQSLPPGITLSGSAVCSTVDGGTAISAGLAVAGYTIDAASCSGLSLSGSGSSNYVIAYTGGTFTVRPAPVAVTVNGSQTFGGSPIFTAGPTSGALPQGVTLDGTPTCTTVNGGTPITSTLGAGGAYSLDAASCTGLSLGGAAAGDYVLSLSGGAFTVTKATPAIVWGPPSAIVYGTALSATQLDATATATVAGQVVAVAGTFAYSPTAGTVLHAGPQSLSTTFTPADSVDFDTATAKVAVTVTAAPLTVTADDASRPFGAPDPAFAVSYQGLVNNDGPASLAGTVMFKTTATPASPPGGYSIVPSGLSSPDYTITYVDGTLTVTRAATTTAVSVSPGNPTLGGLVTFTATVAPAQANQSGVNPTGTVAFYVDGATTAAATVQVAADGTAAFQATLPGGTTTVSAAYSGDANFLGSSTAKPATATIACAQTITGSHTGAVIAAKGLTCIVDAQLSGAVTVEAGASLDVENSTLGGAIVTNGAKSIRVCGDTIGSHGSINVSGSTGFVVVGDPGEDRCAANTVDGALNLLNNTGGLVAVGNTVTGAVNASANRGAGPFPDQTAPEVTGNHH